MCRRNEVYDDCNANCQPTCSRPEPKCPKMCKDGCICKPRYVRDDRNKQCILKYHCPGQ